MNERAKLKSRLLTGEVRQVESVADFKARLAVLMRERETGKRYSVIDAAHANPSVVRNKKI